jgi:hypothetical protein
MASPVDARLLTALAAPVDTVPDVIARMREVDLLLPPEDGLKWFNLLYLMVTEEIGRDVAAARWADGAWLVRLDVVFARLYFEAVVLSIQEPARCPRAWVPLFEARFRPGIARVQYGLAGMNAHINRDLPLAIVRSCEAAGIVPRRGTPQHTDYERVNQILEEVEIAAMQRMATGIIGKIAGDLGRLDDVVAMWKVRAARDAAWTNGEVLWTLREHAGLSKEYLATLDRMAGFAGRGLLIPTEPPR